MKVVFAEDINRQDSGKHKFLRRLYIAFEKLGVHVKMDGKSDIFLHIGRNLEKARSKKIVMRLDGLILNSDQAYEKQNRKFVKYIGASDAVIYQSKFCKRAYEKFLRVKKKSVCIYNGADPAEFLNRSPKDFFLAHCNWRPHKRLHNICEGFLCAQEKGSRSRLLIAGKTEEPIRHNKIKYMGWVGPERLRTLLSEAIATVHIAWLDWCPNTMIESCIAGCPIIYSNSGGSAEIGQNAGVEIDDIQWSFKPCRLYKPPKIDPIKIADAMLKLEKTTIVPKRDDLHIAVIAKKYLSFFEEVLE